MHKPKEEHKRKEMSCRIWCDLIQWHVPLLRSTGEEQSAPHTQLHVCMYCCKTTGTRADPDLISQSRCSQ